MENSNILRNPSNNEIINVIEQNLTGFLNVSLNSIDKDDLLKNFPNYEISVNEDVSKFFMGKNHPMMNVFCNAKFTEQEVEEKVNTILNQAKSKNVPFMWVVGGFTKHINIGRYLEKEGLFKDESPGMYLNLKEIDETKYHKALDQSEIKIKPVSSSSEEEKFIDLFSTILELGELKNDFSYILRIWFKNRDVNAYLANYGGKPVGISMIFYGSGVAGIYNVGVLPEYRNRGFGTVLTLAPLLQAKKKGYEISILSSSELGFKVYSQIGYKECCKFNQFIYIPQPNEEN